MTTLLLASASPARATVLRAAGIHPRIQPADIDEKELLARAEHDGGSALHTTQAVELLARAKAEHVAAITTDVDLVLGCDSLLELDGRTLGKPGTVEVARDRWRAMRGRTGVLHTGHWLIRLAPTGRPQESAGAVSSTAVTFADITDAELEAYLNTGEPLGVAGAFTIDGRGGAFVRHLQGDHHTVVGVSLSTLRDLVSRLGYSWTDLWATDLYTSDYAT